MNKFHSLFIILFFFISCVPSEKQETVVVETTGIQELPTILIENEGRMGDFLIDSEDFITYIEIKNNSKYEITNFDFQFIDTFESNAKMVFQLNELEESIYPGLEGTCSKKLSSNSSCRVYFQFTPNRRGEFLQQIIFSYKNLIEEIRANIFFRAKVGEYASLNFEGDNSIFGFGILDRNEVIGKDQVIDIVNNGGLPASDLSIVINNSVTRVDKNGNADVNEIEKGFVIKDHNCPSVLYPKSGCRVVINYANSNNLIDDPDLIYEGKLSFKYLKASDGAEGTLSANFGFTSTTLRANFLDNYKGNTSDTKTIVGNKSTLGLLTLQNDGFKAGMITAFNVYDVSNRLIARCDSIDLNKNAELVCRKLGGTLVTLDELPIKIYDINKIPCLNRLVRGKGIGIAGETCNFNVVYWPSTKFEFSEKGQDGKNNESKIRIDLEYDTRLRDEENIANKLIKYFTYSFTRPALLTFSTFVDENKVTFENDATFSFEQSLIHPDIRPFDSSTDAFFNLGSLSLVKTDKIQTKFTLEVKNIGETPAESMAISDSQYFNKNLYPNGFPIEAFKDSAKIIDLPSVKYNNQKTFFKKVSTDCPDKLASGQSCYIYFTLNLYKSSDPDIDNRYLFFDHVGSLADNPRDFSFKQFQILYDNKIKYFDNGDPFPKKTTKARITAELLNKGALEFVNLEHWENLKSFAYQANNIPPVFGNEAEFDIYIRNVGTSEISYMSFVENENSSCTPFSFVNLPNGILLPELSSLDYEGEESVTPAYDCYDIINSNELNYGSILSVSPNSLNGKIFSLREEESCVLRVKMKINLFDQKCFEQGFSESDLFEDGSITDNFGVLSSNALDENLKYPFSANEWDINDWMKYQPPPETLTIDKTLDIIYYDGDMNIYPEDSGLRTQNIFGSRKKLIAGKGNSLKKLKVEYESKGNIYLNNLKPELSTIYKRNDFAWRVNTTSPLINMKEAYVFPPSINGFGDTFAQTFKNDFFYNNINFEQYVRGVNQEEADWIIWLGGFPANDLKNHYINFNFNRSGNGQGKIVDCVISLGDSGYFSYDDVNEVVTGSYGIIPSSNFYKQLLYLGCHLDSAPANPQNKLISEINKLNTLSNEGFMLKVKPRNNIFEDFNFKIDFTIEDNLNPELENNPPTRNIRFLFRSKTIAPIIASDDICIAEVDENNTFKTCYDINSDNQISKLNQLKASIDTNQSLKFGIKNSFGHEIKPKFYFRNNETGEYLKKIPNGISIDTNDCITLAKEEGECIFTVDFNPTDTSASIFDLALVFESISFSTPQGQNLKQFREVRLSFETIVLESGELVGQKIANQNIEFSQQECSNSPLSVEKNLYEQTVTEGNITTSSTLQLSSFLVDIGEVQFEDIQHGIYRSFCLKNPKSLPVKIWDNFKNWSVKTIEGHENMIHVSSSKDGSLKLYVEEHCMVRSKDAEGTFKDAPTNANYYGIQSGNDTDGQPYIDTCKAIVFYKPLLDDINHFIGDALSAFNYFDSDVSNTSERPKPILGIKLSGKIIAPQATPIFSPSRPRDIYQIETSHNSAVISWNKFNLDNNFGQISKYAVFTGQNRNNLLDNDKLRDTISTASCIVDVIDPNVQNYSCELLNLSSKRRYFVRVLPIVNYIVDGLETTYVAFDDSTSPHLHSFYTVDYDNTLSYDYLHNIYIDRFILNDEFLDRSGAYLACENYDKTEVQITSSTIKEFSRQIITLDEWELIISDIPKYNSDLASINNYIWIGGEVSKEKPPLETVDYFDRDSYEWQGSSEVQNFGNSFYNIFQWNSSSPPDNFFITVFDMPVYSSDLEYPKYGSLLLLEDETLSSFYTRCYTPLAD